MREEASRSRGEHWPRPASIPRDLKTRRSGAKSLGDRVNGDCSTAEAGWQNERSTGQGVHVQLCLSLGAMTPNYMTRPKAWFLILARHWQVALRPQGLSFHICKMGGSRPQHLPPRVNKGIEE